MTISHKIELIPNNKAITYFKKAFGCSRLAYNGDLQNGKRIIKMELKLII